MSSSDDNSLSTESELYQQQQLKLKQQQQQGTLYLNSESKLSTAAYTLVLREIASILASQLLEMLIFRANFSEWGALLLHQEVKSILIIFTLYL